MKRILFILLATLSTAACMMLFNRSHTISEVAYAVGFNSPKYFTRCFKDEFGVTPSEYLQKNTP